MKEIWKDVVGYENLYQVSNLGNVLSLRHKNRFLMKPTKNKSGYLSVGLRIYNKRKTFDVHRLVAQTFIPNPNNYPVINHKDENPLNNNIENLEWCTIKYNINYGTATERRAKNRSKPVLQFDIFGNFIKEFESIKIAGKETHICKNNICNACRGERKTAGGYIWKYKIN